MGAKVETVHGPGDNENIDDGSLGAQGARPAAAEWLQRMESLELPKLQSPPRSPVPSSEAPGQARAVGQEPVNTSASLAISGGIAGRMMRRISAH